MNITAYQASPRLRWWPRLLHVLFKRHYGQRCYHLVCYANGSQRWKHHCLECEEHLYHETITADESFAYDSVDVQYVWRIEKSDDQG